MSDHSKEQAQAQLEGIVEMMRALHTARNGGEAELDGDMLPEDDIIERITEDPLSVEVRSNWHLPGTTDDTAEYRILLCTGGPACQIVGDLNQYSEPTSATLQHQDWFERWANYTHDDHPELLDYAQMFYFGE